MNLESQRPARERSLPPYIPRDPEAAQATHAEPGPSEGTEAEVEAGDPPLSDADEIWLPF